MVSGEEQFESADGFAEEAAFGEVLSDGKVEMVLQLEVIFEFMDVLREQNILFLVDDREVEQ